MSRISVWFLGGASALAMLLTAVPSSAGASGPLRADEAPPLPATDGASVYERSCAKCHGPDGKGDTGMGKKARGEGKKWPDLTQSKDDADKVLAIIRDGVPDTKMKAYGDKLSAEELGNVRDYVMSFRK